MISKEDLKGMTAEQVAQLLTKVKERRTAAAASANAAITGYENAVRERDAKLQEMKEDLNRQLAIIADKAEALKPAMLKVTIAGDGVALDKAKRTLADLEGQRSQLNAQLELLSGKPTRCDEAYAAMEAAVAKSKETDEQYSSDIGAIREFCEETMKPWSEIISSLRNRGEDVSRFFLDRAREQYSRER